MVVVEEGGTVWPRTLTYCLHARGSAASVAMEAAEAGHVKPAAPEVCCEQRSAPRARCHARVC